MRHPVALHGVYYRVRRQIGKMDERAREESEPDVNGDKAENVAEGKERQKFQRAVVMLFDLTAIFDNVGAAADHRAKLTPGIGAELDVRGGAGRHDEQLVGKRRRKIPVRFFKVGAVDRADGKDLSVGDHGGGAAGGQRVFERVVSQTRVHKERPVTAAEYRPEKLDPQKAGLHVQPDRGPAGTTVERGGEGRTQTQDRIVRLTVRRLFHTVAPALLVHDVFTLGEHQLKKRTHRAVRGVEFFQLAADETVYGPVTAEIFQTHYAPKNIQIFYI